MTEKRFTVFKSKLTGLFVVNDNIHEFHFEGVESASTIMKLVGLLNNYIEENEQSKMMIATLRNMVLEQEDLEKENNELKEENEQLKNKIYILEDDNETYHKSLDKLNLYTKRFIPTNCINEFKDCKTNRYYWLDHEGNFEGCLELLNLLDCKNEVLKSENTQLKGRLMLYEEQIKGDME